ncbi:MAG TPA: Hpt domain-containing protein [Campylobacterales bacterium]|nr:Hpt domain-containing protein [Campylobacterales bacterium]
MQLQNNIDIDKVCDMLMLDRGNVVNLLKKFAAMLPEMSQEIKSAIADNDLKLVNMLGHKLKGTAGNFRIQILYEVAEEINKLPNIDDSSAIMDRLDACIKTVATEIQSLHI